MYAVLAGMSAALGVDDGSTTELSVQRAIPGGAWAWLEWALDDASLWNAWESGSNGQIDAAYVTLDAIWLYRAGSSSPVTLYLDDLTYLHGPVV